MRRALLSLAAAALVAAPAFSADALTAVPYRSAAACDSSGHVFFSDHPDETAYIASVSKLMTAFLVFEDIRDKKYTLATRVVAGEEVAYSEPSWVGLKKGDAMSVRDLLFALLVGSANDAAVVLARHAEGSVEAFVARMNSRAKSLGMERTVYSNPSGLPPSKARRYPWKGFNVSTANDQLRLARALLAHPEVFAFTSVESVEFIKTADGYRVSLERDAAKDGEKLVRRVANHNRLLGRELPSVDGLKTGYIDAGGSSILVSAKEKDRRVFVAVLGSGSKLDAKRRVLRKSADVRDDAARHLLLDILSTMAW